MQQRPENDRQFIAHFLQRLSENPELTLSDFMAEIEADESLSALINPIETELAVLDSNEEDLESILNEIAARADSETDAEPVASLADLMASSRPKTEDDDASDMAEPSKPAFSFRQWYADNSIDFILYLGAFMIVAAVSLFVGFQWQNFSSVMRFALVVVFTVAWYVAGVGIQRFMNLDNVGIAFITIGAVLTPFCGVAWQRFVIDSLDGVGITWLITAVISTILYLTISLVYQRRYFTYFGNLAILASVLSLVEVTSAPFAYYVLAGTVTATILLGARILLANTAPRLDAYLGVDVERSSWGVMAASLIAGIVLLPIFEISIFSIDVFAVLVVTVIYSVLLLTRRLTMWTVILAQVTLLLTIPQGLITFGIDETIALYAAIIAGLGLQYLIEQRFRDEQAPIVTATLTANMALMSLAYFFILILREGGIGALPAGVLLVTYGAYFAYRTDNFFAAAYAALLPYVLVVNIGAAFDTNEDFGFFVFTALGILEMMTILLPVSFNIKRGVLALATMLTGLIAFGTIDAIVFDYADSAFINALNIIALLAVPFAYGVLIRLDKDYENPIIPVVGQVLLAAMPILYYLASVPYDLHLITMLMALATGILFFLVSVNRKHTPLFYQLPTYIAPFVALFHLTQMLTLSDELFIVANAALALILFFAPLPDFTRAPRQYVAMLAAGLVALGAFGIGIEDESMTVHFAGWVNGYALIAMLWLSDDLFEHTLRDLLISVAVLGQYTWTIIYLDTFVSKTIFDDIQWYSAALGTVIIIWGVRNYLRSQSNEDVADASTLFFVIGGMVWLFPTYRQIIFEQSLLYFILGVIYSLSLGAIAITLSDTRLRTVSALALVATVLIQSREFFFGLPRWVVIGFIGFGLLGVGLYLSIRRRNVKKGEPLAE